MEILKIALLQMKGTGTVEGNLQKGIEFCKKAKRQGADIALFPEMWNIGYEIPEARWRNGTIYGTVSDRIL